MTNTSNKRYFAGIGTRDLPGHIRDFIIDGVCPVLVSKELILRSGGAEGADLAFEHGYDVHGGRKEIYIPWKNFNKSSSKLIGVSDDSYEMAQQFHPYWKNLDDYAKKLHARNCCQVLGQDLKTPSDFVLCYTKDGAERKKQISPETGGTGQALRIACHYGIRIINMKKYFDSDNFLNDFTPEDLLQELSII